MSQSSEAAVLWFRALARIRAYAWTSSLNARHVYAMSPFGKLLEAKTLQDLPSVSLLREYAAYFVDNMVATFEGVDCV
jgi:hypothetical protein